MTTYFFSTLSGSDNNSGTSADAAWSNFSKLSGKLKAGDTILLERGSDFDQTLAFNKVNGTSDMPITISSYGAGNAPILSSSTGNGVQAIYANNFVLENVTIQDTAGSGIYGLYANNWTLHNVTFTDAGGKNYNGSVNWWNSSNLVFENNAVTNSHGDGMYLSNVNNTVIRDNDFHNVTGANADSIQIQGNNAVISGNILLIDEASNTTKGNIVFMGNNLYTHDNYLQGGSFGMSVSGSNVLIESNVMKDHNKYSWSSNVQFTDQVSGDNVTNITIRDNQMEDANRNITFDGKNTTSANMNVSNLHIEGNEFKDWTKAPVVLNGVNVIGNVADNTSNKDGYFVSGPNSDLSKLIAHDNYLVPSLPVATLQPALPLPKEITIVASGSLFQGGAPTLILLVNGIAVGQQDVTALRAQGQKQTLTFEIPKFAEGDKFSIQYANDRADQKLGQDRNLYVHSISMDGVNLNLRGADLTAKVVHQKDGTGMFFSSNATATFTSDDVPQSMWSKPFVPEPAPLRLEDILERDDHVIFYGNEHHTVGVTSAPVSTYGSLISGMEELHSAMAQIAKEYIP